jgi:rifampicin phosphotransferase
LSARNRENHVYVSVGHNQMMTEAMRPLGVSVWQLTALTPMHEAGGRLFVDVTERLASPRTRAGLLEVMGRADPMIGDALQTILERGDFLPSPDEGPGPPPVPGAAPAQIDTDPAIVTELIERTEASIAALKRDIQTKSGPAPPGEATVGGPCRRVGAACPPSGPGCNAGRRQHLEVCGDGRRM